MPLYRKEGESVTAIPHARGNPVKIRVIHIDLESRVATFSVEKGGICSAGDRVALGDSYTPLPGLKLDLQAIQKHPKYPTKTEVVLWFDASAPYHFSNER